MYYLQFWRSEVNCVSEADVLRRLQGRTHFRDCSRGWLHSLAQGPISVQPLLSSSHLCYFVSDLPAYLLQRPLRLPWAQIIQENLPLSRSLIYSLLQSPLCHLSSIFTGIRVWTALCVRLGGEKCSACHVYMLWKLVSTYVKWRYCCLPHRVLLRLLTEVIDVCKFPAPCLAP